MSHHISPPVAAQCVVCPWFMAFRSANFCDGALMDKPSCWWECEGKPAMDLELRLRRLISFRQWCQANGLSNEKGEWLFNLPQDWEWDGQQWVLRKAPHYDSKKGQLLQHLQMAAQG